MQRKKYTAQEKTKIVLELISGEHEVNEIASREGINPNLIRNWKGEFLDNATLIFDNKRDERLKAQLAKKQDEADRLAKKVGHLSVQIDFLEDVLERK